MNDRDWIGTGMLPCRMCACVCKNQIGHQAVQEPLLALGRNSSDALTACAQSRMIGWEVDADS